MMNHNIKEMKDLIKKTPEIIVDPGQIINKYINRIK